MKTFSTDSAYPMPQQKHPSFRLAPPQLQRPHEPSQFHHFDRDSLWFFNRLIFIKLGKHVTTMKWATVFHFYFPTMKTRTVAVGRSEVDIIPFNIRL